MGREEDREEDSSGRMKRIETEYIFKNQTHLRSVPY